MFETQQKHPYDFQVAAKAARMKEHRQLLSGLQKSLRQTTYCLFKGKIINFESDDQSDFDLGG